MQQPHVVEHIGCTDVTVISPTNTGLSFTLAEVWRRRRLLYVFVWRDVKVRYKQTLIGAAWTVLQPLLAMLVFTLVFGRLAKVSTGDIPYAVFVYCGLLPWQFFSQGLVRSGNSLVDNRYLLTKVNLPRIILPLAAILAGLPDFAVSLLALVGLMLYFGITPGLSILAVVPILSLAIATALGFGLFLSALNARFRDVGYTTPFLAQVWFFLTPVAYPEGLIPSRWRMLYHLNPMTGVVESLRWAVLGHSGGTWTAAITSLLIVSLLLCAGILYFHRAQQTFADVI
jgi:lipopolysaccharide transport system permease protein